MHRTMRATVGSRSGASCLRCVRPRCAGCVCVHKVQSLGVFWFGLHLAQEMSAAILLQAAGEDLAAGLRHQQGVFELSRALAVSGHRCPAVWPRLILPAT